MNDGINCKIEYAAALLNPHIANREQHVNARMEDHPGVPKDSEKTEQKHKGIDTQDVDSLRRHQSETAGEEIGVKSRLWCARCRKRKEYPELNLAEPTRRLFERIKKRSKECGKPDEAVAGVSTASHRESISRRSTPRKSKRSSKQDATVEVAEDKDAFERARRERKERREKRRRDKEEEKRKEIRVKERKERRKREERIPRLLDARLVLHDERLVAEDRVSRKPLPAADPTKSCCYLCAQNTLAIAAASLKPQQSDKCIQVSAHKFRTEMPTLDKSCSTTLLVRTVQSSVKVKTRETGTLCPGARREGTKPRTKRKKFSVFSGLTRTKCPAGRHAACETDKSARRDNAEKHREPRSEKCCREKND